MSDPTCPRCGTPASEHAANDCLDMWLAITVMGLAVPPGREPPYEAVRLWRLSSSWEGMGMVVEAMHAKNVPLSLVFALGVIDLEAWGWQAHFRRGECYGFADSAPLAVARAAMMAADTTKGAP